ncbi:ABC transporter ATP-binding protein [Alteribacillus bidgolensis]|uniref:Peptide/nickel transport system ATP-binding protein/oligopeptide transport system ATP-binding protein n=1 Tax=Alteribacillus bidgolensis TaxID=930129 RepID=A0A1G8K7H1_9BACI|nr:ABC transporter ATP-binding protein [Alteribacillus bidgolensis]SDI39309.1 peptide/nickel transport system ATP-binding protein/oligopeptide transport system ATP-binding protein [Alteribacillus bidgolensis]
MANDQTLLEVEHLQTHFFTENGVIPSINDISFSLNKGEIVALVGESGSGKSVTSMSIMGLIEDPGKIVNGNIIFDNQDLTSLTHKKYQKIRRNDMSMVFQEPLTALNPVFSIGFQLIETIKVQQKTNKKKAKEIAFEWLEKVRIPNPDKVFASYPHELSGGMRQRVMIAMALSSRPRLLIADEPTTALDVTIQKQILRLMKNLTKELDTAILFITHDLGIVAEMVDRVMVMYGGEIVEKSDVKQLFHAPKHPYTEGLLKSTPKINQWGEKLHAISGTVPTPSNLPKGCKFHPRCPKAFDRCETEHPPLIDHKDGSQVRCLLYER